MIKWRIASVWLANKEKKKRLVLGWLKGDKRRAVHNWPVMFVGFSVVMQSKVFQALLAFEDNTNMELRFYADDQSGGNTGKIDLLIGIAGIRRGCDDHKIGIIEQLLIRNVPHWTGTDETLGCC